MIKQLGTLMPRSVEDSIRTAHSEVFYTSDLPESASGSRQLREASVLIPLLKQNDDWHVLYIRRSKNLHDRHSGQVAFPGGASEGGDQDAIDTALRETREEIGISRDNITVVGTLPAYETVSYFRVTPIVGLLAWPCTMKLQTSEVARAFTIPLDWLLDDSHYTLRDRQQDTKQSGTTRDVSRRRQVVYFDEYDGEVLWGASARITLNFLLALKQGTLLIPGWRA